MKTSFVPFFLPLFVSLLPYSCMAQKTSGGPTSVREVERIETVLASDSFQGRATGSTGIRKAADFIGAEFKKAGLQPLQGTGFLQEFVMQQPTLVALTFKAGGTDLDTKSVVVFTSEPTLEVDETSGYAVEQIKAGDNFSARARQFVQSGKNTIVLVDSVFAPNVLRLNRMRQQQFKRSFSTIFLVGKELPKAFRLKAEHRFAETALANVVGVLPGKSRKDEMVIFSGHYDHLGIGRPVAGDSIYNGANDDAAGTTAVILLANHFKKLANNERTLIFAAFTAEEVGGFGSQYFSQQLNPEKVVAMFNIEMIGTESKWGKASAYITGYEKSNMGEILQAALKGSGFAFYQDPYPQQQLFYRSDNATLARLGVPAHTISTSKMDSEPNYHRPSDEVRTLDLENMAQIINAIAESSKTIVSGKDTPTRVKTEGLN